MTNAQIMAGGNRFLALWVNEDIEIEDMEERDELKQLYAIKNWSEEFDISEGIPSGEPAMNAYEEDSFYGKVMVDRKFSPAKSYSATYTYEMEVLNAGQYWDNTLQDYTNTVIVTFHTHDNHLLIDVGRMYE